MANELYVKDTKINVIQIGEQDYIPQPERLKKLNQIAISQMKVLNENDNRKLLK